MQMHVPCSASRSSIVQGNRGIMCPSRCPRSEFRPTHLTGANVFLLRMYQMVNTRGILCIVYNTVFLLIRVFICIMYCPTLQPGTPHASNSRPGFGPGPLARWAPFLALRSLLRCNRGWWVGLQKQACTCPGLGDPVRGCRQRILLSHSCAVGAREDPPVCVSAAPLGGERAP
jgi:hypothetical protein